MSRATCPSFSDLERLSLGDLPEQEAEGLEQHVLECSSCLEKLKKRYPARDTLAGVRSDDTAADAVASCPVVAALMDKLESLRPASASPPGETPMISLCCSACQKQFSVNEELSGTQGQCPGCGQAVTIPARVAAPVNKEMATLPPAPGPNDSALEQRTESSQAEAGKPATDPALSNPDATQGTGKLETGSDSPLTDFLAPPQADDELGRLGKYRILKVLGHGGMGVVFQAEDPILKRSVALKAMLPTLAASASASKRFLREAQAMAAVEHDHIVRIYQVDEEHGVPFLAMEFLKGEPLDQRLKRPETLPLSEVLRIGREIADGLAAAHATGLIHRDIKPANIWLEGPRNRVKILDFGLARAVSEDAGLTQQGAIIGTPAYMAPEQGRGDPVDARCDLFSLGVVLYRLCTGQQPFQGKDTVSTLMAVALNQPAPLRTMNAQAPPELADLVMKLLEKDPDRRPESASAVVAVLQILEKVLARQNEPRDDTQALTAALPMGAAASGLQDGPAGRAPGKVPSRSRRRLTLLLGSLVVFGGLLGVGAFALIRVQTDEGNYVINTDDPDFSFQVSKGAVTLEDRKTNHKYNLKVLRQEKAAGEHELEVTDSPAGLSFKTKTFTIKRGEKVALKAWFERKQAVAAKQPPPPGDDAWLKQVAGLPAEKQVEAVAALLKERNPSFDGKVTSNVTAGVVTVLQFSTDNVTDLSPVRALMRLQTLNCGATRAKGQLADLTPLKDMKLTGLDCRYTKVTDLSPLKDMKLTYLNCLSTKVTDLSPLKDMKLTQLHCGGTMVTDLSPLKSMKLTSLNCGDTKVADLSSLKDMKLTSLYCGETKVTNLSPLKDMKLTMLDCHDTKVSDLSPLKDMELTSLWCHDTKVTDLSLLTAMPLNDLRCDFNPPRDTGILRSIKTLERINLKPAKAFWQEVDTRKREKKP